MLYRYLRDPHGVGGARIRRQPRLPPCDPGPGAAFRRRALAVDGIDLAVGRGEIYGFLGPNGAGKSTAVRVLCTLLRPHDGVAFVAGHDVARHPQAVRLRIGVALQETALDDRQTGRELLTLQGRLYGMTAAQVRHRMSASARPGRHRCRHRPSDRHLLGWDEAPSRPGRRPDPPSRGALPRRADHRARPAQSGHRLGRDPPAQRGAGDDHLPHDPVPRRGRCARRSGRDHRPGSVVAEGTPRRAETLRRPGSHRGRGRRARIPPSEPSCGTSTGSTPCRARWAGSWCSAKDGAGRAEPGGRRPRRHVACG